MPGLNCRHRDLHAPDFLEQLESYQIESVKNFEIGAWQRDKFYSISMSIWSIRSSHCIEWDFLLFHWKVRGERVETISLSPGRAVSVGAHPSAPTGRRDFPPIANIENLPFP
jgi:hypothetical protein